VAKGYGNLAELAALQRHVPGRLIMMVKSRTSTSPAHLRGRRRGAAGSGQSPDGDGQRGELCRQGWRELEGDRLALVVDLEVDEARAHPAGPLARAVAAGVVEVRHDGGVVDADREVALVIHCRRVGHEDYVAGVLVGGSGGSCQAIRSPRAASARISTCSQPSPASGGRDLKKS
jgi:hypothetical protein